MNEKSRKYNKPKKGGYRPHPGEAKKYDHLLTACMRDPRVPAAAKGLYAYMIQNRQAIRTGSINETVMHIELCMSDKDRQAAISLLNAYGYLPGTDGGEQNE